MPAVISPKSVEASFALTNEMVKAWKERPPIRKSHGALGGRDP